MFTWSRIRIWTDRSDTKLLLSIRNTGKFPVLKLWSQMLWYHWKYIVLFGKCFVNRIHNYLHKKQRKIFLKNLHRLDTHLTTECKVLSSNQCTFNHLIRKNFRRLKMSIQVSRLCVPPIFVFFFYNWPPNFCYL